MVIAALSKVDRLVDRPDNRPSAASAASGGGGGAARAAPPPYASAVRDDAAARVLIDDAALSLCELLGDGLIEVMGDLVMVWYIWIAPLNKYE